MTENFIYSFLDVLRSSHLPAVEFFFHFVYRSSCFIVFAASTDIKVGQPNVEELSSKLARLSSAKYLVDLILQSKYSRDICP